MEKYKINSNSDILFRFIIIALMVNQSLLMALRNQNSRIVTFRAFRLSVMPLTYVILTEKSHLKKSTLLYLVVTISILTDMTFNVQKYKKTC